MGIWKILSLLQRHRCQMYKGAHQNPTSEEQTPPVSFFVSQMEQLPAEGQRQLSGSVLLLGMTQ